MSKKEEETCLVRRLSKVKLSEKASSCTAELFQSRKQDSVENDSLEKRVNALKTSQMFQYCPSEVLEALAKELIPATYHKGDHLIRQGDKQTNMFMIIDGSILREKVVHNQLHHVDLYSTSSKSSFGALHMLNEDPSYATAICESDTVQTYVLTSKTFKKHLDAEPELAQAIIYSLARTVRHFTKTLRTPLLEQKAKETPWFATSVAASVESFYRSALNALLNRRLTGQHGAFFPNMHIQLPTRVLYINGFKGIRHILENNIHAEDYSNPNLVRLLAAVTPGVIMTPVSSMLEACNAGHMNPEPLQSRWIRGILPRGAREIIFGIGLNQLSDYCEERTPGLEHSPALRNAIGSMIAGVISGYLSHVPHNLSTLKLMEPNKSYRQLMSELVDKSEKRVPKVFTNPTFKRRFAYGMAVLLPRGVMIRTTQVVGSFIILNGTIQFLGSMNK